MKELGYIVDVDELLRANYCQSLIESEKELFSYPSILHNRYNRSQDHIRFTPLNLSRSVRISEKVRALSHEVIGSEQDLAYPSKCFMLDIYLYQHSMYKSIVAKRIGLLYAPSMLYARLFFIIIHEMLREFARNMMINAVKRSEL